VSNTATPSHRSPGAPYAPAIAHNDCWTALTEDAGICVYVFDLDGRLLDASPRVIAAHGLAHDDIGRITVHDMLPEPLAQERLELFRTVARTRLPASYESFTRGVRYRATIRPSSDPTGERTRLLVTATPIALHPSAGRTPARELSPNGLGPLAQLTRRELEVLGLIGEGLSTAGIADRLKRSIKTVEGHRVSLGNKLGVSNRVELARIAIRAGLCPFDPVSHDDPVEAPIGG